MPVSSVAASSPVDFGGYTAPVVESPIVVTGDYIATGTAGDDRWDLVFPQPLPEDTLAVLWIDGLDGTDTLSIDWSALGSSVYLGGFNGDDYGFTGGGGSWNFEVTGVEEVALIGGAGAVTVYLNTAAIRLGVVGSASADTLWAGSADDRLFGGAGDDDLFGGAGGDLVRGDAGDDSINGGHGNDTIFGGDGDDAIRGGGTIPVSYGTVMEGTGDQIHGGDGNDSILGEDGNSLIYGDAGNDTIQGGDWRDTIFGGDGDDLLSGGSTAGDLRDEIHGGAGYDTIDGGYGDDSLSGDDGDDSITGGVGNDTVLGGNGNDFLDGGAGNDLLVGNEQMDTIVGGLGADTLFGGADADLLVGGALSDVLVGGDGSDFLNGGSGFDRLSGGGGSDLFYHTGLRGHGTDWIEDYTAATFDALAFGITTATAADFQVNLATTPNAGDAAVEEAFVVYRPTGQIIWALVDGAANDNLWLQFGATAYYLPI